MGDYRDRLGSASHFFAAGGGTAPEVEMTTSFHYQGQR
ncbi:hypothetical protein LT85_1928 [Collimonas arenae]|uniref:Uncharacterized protein n=1 Tax=Collimonas arenae TaxID=279058 RepID=A0A0A1F968_9BURK|nr:hypothetical protein LT85_1928 [Collimonas arenae]